MSSPDSPFMSCPSASNFSSVFVENPDKISKEFERCRPPRKRNSLTVSLSTDNIFLKKSTESARAPPIAPIVPNLPNSPNRKSSNISTSNGLKFVPQ